ncbi:MAG: hypothetical protein GF349_03855 [Candidatus Magasanikbacteria bacterium]|nr:hypothetical protein [Candidatus Magasanikbacteria bacterium]
MSSTSAESCVGSTAAACVSVPARVNGSAPGATKNTGMNSRLAPTTDTLPRFHHRNRGFYFFLSFQLLTYWISMLYLYSMSEEILDKILTKVVNIEDKMDNLATKEDLRVAKDEIIGDVDRFVKLHETLDHELVALRNKYDRLEERIKKLETGMVST